MNSGWTRWYSGMDGPARPAHLMQLQYTRNRDINDWRSTFLTSWTGRDCMAEITNQIVNKIVNVTVEFIPSQDKEIVKWRQTGERSTGNPKLNKLILIPTRISSLPIDYRYGRFYLKKWTQRYSVTKPSSSWNKRAAAAAAAVPISIPWILKQSVLFEWP